MWFEEASLSKGQILRAPLDVTEHQTAASFLGCFAQDEENSKVAGISPLS